MEQYNPQKTEKKWPRKDFSAEKSTGQAKYNPKEIEKKWQKEWEENNLYRAEDFSEKPKKYILIEFPYPSGEGLHVGHARSYSALDAVARKKRMEGYNVLFPIGWDAFGLPTENYAIRTGIHPRVATEKNITNYRRQLQSLGLSFDWSREVNTTDPKYYKWTQMIFLKLFEKGLAYQTEIPINWCPSCKIGLANEEVVGGGCERCGAPAEKKVLKQWMLKITAYADRLIEDLQIVDYPEKVKAQQINWIGKSYGTEIDFKIVDSDEAIKVFTTRIDTLFGVTAIVLAPEHPFVASLLKSKIQDPKSKNLKEVEEYIEKTKEKSEFERTKLEKEKTGVFTGSFCINSANSERIPIWVGDYVVGTYGGGAVMVVPAHDYRDYDFAVKYNLPIRQVVSPIDADKDADLRRLEDAFVGYGRLINSGEFNGLSSKEAIEKLTEWLEKKGLGRKQIQYKLRDWVFSRQHYWGEPIPIIHCQKCGSVPVPEKDLPIELPYVEKYQPTGTGESPLSAISDWLDTRCPKCEGPAKRETDTMPNWAGSNWYFIRYCDPHNDKVLADEKKLKYWLPVDWYNGGFEHTTLHLLYSRFIYKFLYDIGITPTPEPYQRRTSHGIVLAEDGRKMSKSFGNVINPDDIVKEFGADSLRLYEMFIGPFDQTIAWSTQGVKGVYRFLEKVWKLQSKTEPPTKIWWGAKVEKRTKFSSTFKSQNLERLLHKTIKKINEDLENCKFNTIVSALMLLVNALNKQEKVFINHYSLFLILLFPFAPHISEELWEKLGHKESITLEKWPEPKPEFLKEEKITMIIQVNGKVRGKVEVEADISKEKAQTLAISQEKIKNWVEGKEIKKVIFVPNKLINIVTNL